MKALELLQSNKSVKERAESYAVSIQRNIKRDVIDTIVDKLDRLKDSLFELTNFTLDTNLNKGLSTMTKDDCEARFKKIIETEYQIRLTELELQAKQESFDRYFSEQVKVSVGISRSRKQPK